MVGAGKILGCLRAIVVSQQVPVDVRSWFNFARESAGNPVVRTAGVRRKQLATTKRDVKQHIPQEGVVVRGIRLHLYAVHDLLPDVERRNNPGDHEPQPRFDEVSSGASPPTRSEHVVPGVHTFLGLGIDGFEEALGFERVWFRINRFVPRNRPATPAVISFAVFTQVGVEPTRCFQSPTSLWARSIRCTHRLPSGDGADLFGRHHKLSSSHDVQANRRTERCGRGVSQALAHHSLDVRHRRTITKVRQPRMANDRIHFRLGFREHLGMQNHGKNKIGKGRTGLGRPGQPSVRMGLESRKWDEPYRYSRCTLSWSSI